ncbi:MAG: DUF4391 domain-containing protein, partial [Rickettsiales bacterium]|nr:DUF4391 domain-containing protein [Rickettsiales bacterium]
LEGRGVDAIYEGFIRQISDGKLENTSDKTLKERVHDLECLDKIERQIERLECKIKNEPQIKRKIEIKEQIKNLKNLKESLCSKR